VFIDENSHGRWIPILESVLQCWTRLGIELQCWTTLEYLLGLTQKSWNLVGIIQLFQLCVGVSQKFQYHVGIFQHFGIILVFNLAKIPMLDYTWSYSNVVLVV
jgi:hypothetical protein